MENEPVCPDKDNVARELMQGDAYECLRFADFPKSKLENPPVEGGNT